MKWTEHMLEAKGVSMLALKTTGYGGFYFLTSVIGTDDKVEEIRSDLHARAFKEDTSAKIEYAK